MRVNIIAFALGVWLLQQQAQLPSLLHLTLICITAAAFFGLNKWLKTRIWTPPRLQADRSLAF